MTDRFTQGHALIVGVGGDLPTTVQDAEGMVKILTDPERCAYPGGQVQALSAAQATRDGILAGLTRLAEQAGPDSTVIVYFSGHGFRASATIGEAYFLMPFGYDLSRLTETAISEAEFVTALRAIRSQKLLVLLDCCHAGGVDAAKAPGLSLSKAPLSPEARAQLAQGQGRAVIASSRATELSYAGKPYSAFTVALIEALCGEGAASTDGYVRMTDLALHARQMVPQRTRDRQHPVLDFAQADNFVVAYYAAGGSVAKGLPFKAESIEIEPEPGAFAAFDQRGQTVHGPQTNIQGPVHGPVLSGSFQGGVTFGGSTVSIGGDVVGRDKITTHHGDSITVGDISGSSGVAIGRGARATVSTTTGSDLAAVFAKLNQQIAARPEDPDVDKDELRETVQRLEKELTNAQAASPSKLERWLTTLVGLAPDLVQGLPALLSTVSSAGGQLLKQVVTQVLMKGG